MYVSHSHGQVAETRNPRSDWILSPCVRYIRLSFNILYIPLDVLYLSL